MKINRITVDGVNYVEINSILENIKEMVQEKTICTYVYNGGFSYTFYINGKFKMTIPCMSMVQVNKIKSTLETSYEAGKYNTFRQIVDLL